MPRTTWETVIVRGTLFFLFLALINFLLRCSKDDLIFSNVFLCGCVFFDIPGDDDNNNGGCDWDGGDCCGPDNSYNFCSDCACLDCMYVADGDDCVDSFENTCKNAAYAGDGFCKNHHT